LVAGALLLLQLGGCETPPPALPRPAGEPSPIPLGEDGSPPIFFEKIKIRVRAGEPIIQVYEARSKRRIGEEVWDGQLKETQDYNIAITDRLAEYGYDSVDPTDDLFMDGSVMTRHRMRAILTDVQIYNFVKRRNPFYREGNIDRARGLPNSDSAFQRRYMGVRQEVSLELEFKLYDVTQRKVIYARSFRGYGAEEGTTEAVAIDDAVMNALDMLLSDPDFVEAVRTAPGPSGSEEDALPTASLPRCPVEEDLVMPGDLAGVLNAVVTVRNGAIAGSGVIVTEGGYVMTAAHVAPEGSTPTVQLSTGVVLEAVVDRIDWKTDLALLKIPGRSHPCLLAAAATLPPVGSEIYAIGSPGGERLSQSVTRGIVSAHRDVRGTVLIQTDASINRGNSGGPLIGRDGNVLGIVTTKTIGLGMEGIAFGVPVSEAQQRLAIEWE
jgi:S1-C subfamily serine protease